MEKYPEEPSGVRDRGLLESALMRPVHAAAYRDADALEQAATLLWGLVKDHPFVQGNKRTAVTLALFFLERVGYRIEAPQQTVVDIIYAIDGGCSVGEVVEWFRRYTTGPEDQPQ